MSLSALEDFTNEFQGKNQLIQLEIQTKEKWRDKTKTDEDVLFLIVNTAQKLTNQLLSDLPYEKFHFIQDVSVCRLFAEDITILHLERS